MGRAKALLPFRGGTFLSTLADTIGKYCEPVYAVFGFDAEQMMKNAPTPLVAVENPDYQQGMLTSLQAGLRAMEEMPERVLFTLVDHPAVAGETVRVLLETKLETGAVVAMPRYRGKRGHPVLMAASVAREVLAAGREAKLNSVLDRHAAEIRYVDVDDAGVRDDIDDPESYRELLAREGAGV